MVEVLLNDIRRRTRPSREHEQAERIALLEKQLADARSVLKRLLNRPAFGHDTGYNCVFCEGWSEDPDEIEHTPRCPVRRKAEILGE
jgi:hypothetical protein